MIQELDYGRLVERALRRVAHDALSWVAEHGLPGRHHLYITFRTDAEGVVLADELRARYPTEMTVVLQYEFWGLEVQDDRFAVTLSFGSVPHRLEIPFDAITVFADPSVEFGLQFTSRESDDAQAPPLRPAPAPAVEPPGAQPEPAEKDGAEVVTLDQFRRK